MVVRMGREPPRRVVVLGSTGSIGRQAIDVIQAHPDRFEVAALVAGRDAESLEAQSRSTGCAVTGLGPEAAVELAALVDCDVVLNAIVGAAGLRASVAALEAGKVLALANKESLVAGGEVCLDACQRGGGRIVPVDSEHAAISQCLHGHDRASVARIILTASGGPFRRRSDLSEVGPEDALKHPTWSMGPKITIDSATLMNKGLEVIEAHFLFGAGYDDIDVVVHPQSLVHGIVEFADGTMLMQAAPTDMRIPIQAALDAAGRFDSPAGPLDLAGIGTLEFEPVDHRRFPCLGLAYEAGRRGGSYPAALNAANEEAVGAFLGGFIAFLEIPAIIEKVMDDHVTVESGGLEAILEADVSARHDARSAIERLRGSAVGGSA